MDSTGCSGLFYIQHKSLEIFALGVINVDGMVGWLGELVQDAHLSLGLGCCTENCKPELVLVHRLGTGKGEQDAAGGQFLECLGIEAAIAYQGIAQGTLVLGECRRVENDQVIGILLHVVEEFEGILGKGAVTSVLGSEIQCHVVVGEANGLG